MGVPMGILMGAPMGIPMAPATALSFVAYNHHKKSNTANWNCMHQTVALEVSAAVMPCHAISIQMFATQYNTIQYKAPA
jgi:hypothetical protein